MNVRVALIAAFCLLSCSVVLVHALPSGVVADEIQEDWFWKKKSTPPPPPAAPKCPVTGKPGAACPAMKPAVDSTVSGCRCKTKCGATLSHKYSRCSWCWTENRCGRQSWRGSWDYCAYPAMEEFDRQTHADKLDQIWARVIEPGVIDDSNTVQGTLSTVKSMVTESMIDAFDPKTEVIVNGRDKVIHKQGVHCKIDLDIAAGSPFTGILAPGKRAGIIRMGSAASLEGKKDAMSIFPGYGIKFLRTGMQSANWVGLRATGSGGSRNFFEDALSNHVPPSDALIKLNKFQQASGCIDMVGLSEAASATQEGVVVDKPVFPFEILFDPTGAATFVDEAKTDYELLMELAGIPSGTKIFDVYAYASPKDKKEGRKLTLGSLTTTSRCHRSLFGDKELFFRHTRMEEDFAKAPEWMDQMKLLGEDKACAVSARPIAEWQCKATDAEEGLDAADE